MKSTAMVRKPPKKKAKRAKLPTLPALKRKAWKLLSECIRREAANADGYVFCFTCDEPMHWKQAQAGHGISGRTGSTLLDEEIIRSQCYRDNVLRHGEYGIFAVRLDEENGQGWYAAKIKESRSVKKLSREYLEDRISVYLERLAVLNG